MEKTTAFITSDNKIFHSREEAQKHELGLIISSGCGPEATLVAERIADCIMENKDKIRAILADRKPRQPKAVAKRKSKPTVAPAAKEPPAPAA